MCVRGSLQAQARTTKPAHQHISFQKKKTLNIFFSVSGQLAREIFYRVSQCEGKHQCYKQVSFTSQLDFIQKTRIKITYMILSMPCHKFFPSLNARKQIRRKRNLSTGRGEGPCSPIHLPSMLWRKNKRGGSKEKWGGGIRKEEEGSKEIEIWKKKNRNQGMKDTDKRRLLMTTNTRVNKWCW